MIRPIRPTICGARPSDGSSSSSSDGLGHQRPADGQHLLLAAGQQAGPLPGALGQHREQLLHPLPGLGPGGRRACAQATGPQVVLDGHPGEHLPPLGHRDHPAPDHHRRVEPVDALAVDPDLARGDRAPVQLEGARDRAQQGRLAGAVAAEHREDPVVGHLDVDVVERPDRAAVPHGEPAHAQHARAPARRRNPMTTIELPRSATPFGRSGHIV
jgi:hypothetical protein